jgi:AbrB family looped-hinge helix DNA binding protein
MSKVTSKLQITVPKAIADRYGIRPGDELEWTAGGESIRVELVRGRAKAGQLLSLNERVELFDRGTERLSKILGERLKKAARSKTRRGDRGWTREELYERGLPR